jgi:excisionase family DNA binding protein
MDEETEKDNTENRPKFYTTFEVAEMLKMNVQVVARKLQKGEIPGYKIGKDWRVSESGLWNWLEKHSNQRISEADKIVNRYLKSGRFLSLPAQRKKKRYILQYILQKFETHRTYSEKEVNEIILKYHDDFCTVRREFIMEKMMTRAEGKYIRNSSYFLKD